MPNRISIGNARAFPKQIPSAGGTVTIQFEARTSEGPATATVQYSVASGFPFRVSSGGSASASVTTKETTVSNDVTVRRTQATTVSFIQMEITASIPGNTKSDTCFVWIAGDVGVHLRNLREQNGLTQRAFAESAGLSVSTISRIERGSTPSAATELAIVKELS